MDGPDLERLLESWKARSRFIAQECTTASIRFLNQVWTSQTIAYQSIPTYQDPFETFIAFICSANNNIPRITSLVWKFAAAFGTPIVLDDDDGWWPDTSLLPHQFPSIHQVIHSHRFSQSYLRQQGFGYRAHSIHESVLKLFSTQLPPFSTGVPPKLPDSSSAISTKKQKKEHYQTDQSEDQQVPNGLAANQVPPTEIEVRQFTKPCLQSNGIKQIEDGEMDKIPLLTLAPLSSPNVLHQLARQVKEGNVTYNDVTKYLISNFRGVGKKVADCIALYGLKLFTAVPVDTRMDQIMRENELLRTDLRTCGKAVAGQTARESFVQL